MFYFFTGVTWGKYQCLPITTSVGMFVFSDSVDATKDGMFYLACDKRIGWGITDRDRAYRVSHRPVAEGY